MRPLTAVGPDERARWMSQLGDRAAHDRAFDELASLGEIEVSSPPSGRSTDGPLRVVAWNVERGGAVDEIAAALAAARVDVALLTELDVGMARSGNVHTVAEIARRLGHGYAYAVEFIELGLGGERERDELAGQTNADGFHGNAVVTALPMLDHRLVRFDTSGSWFTTESAEARVGGRMALLCRLAWNDGELVAGSVHLESESGPDLRTEQMRVVLDAVDEWAGEAPVVLGGDLNTFSAPLSEVMARGGFRRFTEQDPSRWAWPVPYEPLFERASARGYEIAGANERVCTVRFTVDQEPDTLPRLDWLLTRGVIVSDPATIPSIGRNGQIVSDHDAVAVTIVS